MKLFRGVGRKTINLTSKLLLLIITGLLNTVFNRMMHRSFISVTWMWCETRPSLVRRHCLCMLTIIQLNTVFSRWSVLLALRFWQLGFVCSILRIFSRARTEQSLECISLTESFLHKHTVINSGEDVHENIDSSESCQFCFQLWSFQQNAVKIVLSLVHIIIDRIEEAEWKFP